MKGKELTAKEYEAAPGNVWAYPYSDDAGKAAAEAQFAEDAKVVDFVGFTHVDVDGAKCLRAKGVEKAEKVAE